MFLHNETVERVRAHVRRLKGRQPEAPLFQRRNGQPRPVKWAQRLFRRVLARAGIERRVIPHMMRHTFATRFLESGGDLRAAQRLMRHKRMSSTLIYADYSTDEALRR